MFRYFENLIDPYCEYTQTDTPPTKLWPFLRGYCRPFYGVLVLMTVTEISIAALELGVIFGVGWFVDVIQTTPNLIVDYAVPGLIALAVFYLLIRPVLFGINILLFNQTLDANSTMLVRWRAYRQVLRHSVGSFENDFAGRISNRVMETPNSISHVLGQVFGGLSYAIAFVFGALLMLLQTDARLILPLLVWLLLYSLLMRWTIRRVAKASKTASAARSALNGRIIDGYTNIHSVKMFAHDKAEIGYVKQGMETARVAFFQVNRLVSKMEITLSLLNGLLMVTVVGGAVILWLDNRVQVGSVVAATLLVLRINSMSEWVIHLITGIFRALGKVSEGMETIAQPVTLVDVPKAKPLQVPQAKIEICELSHHYGRDRGGLDRLNLTIQPGEKIGLVGRSGAGKSTLLKLLLRFYDVEAGKILIDGQDIAKVTQDSLRAQIGMVQQDSSLLHRSVRDNIRYGRQNATQAEILAASKQAVAHDFIVDLKDLDGNSGYEALVGERGVKLSGGERQRISLARVILKNAPILLLDEATSALDSEIEAEILNTLYGMMQGKTVIAIAHRLSTIARMDRIIVMDNGSIVENGPHQALLEQNGLYATFWARQSGGFIDIKAVI